MSDEAATVALPSELMAELDAIASHTGRSRAELASEAVAEYVSVQRWQLAGIEEAIREDDAGAPTIPHDRIKNWVASWATGMELPPPEAD